MDDNTRKSTVTGKRPLAESSATGEEAVKRCDVCHGPLKPPVYELASRRSPFSSQRRGACSDCGAADMAEQAIDIVSQRLGYIKVRCPNEMYGCGGYAERDAATHAAVCAHAPLMCPKCAFVGSPAQFARHLADTDGPHVWADWSLGGLAEAAIDVVSKHLRYYMVPCPYEEYGCASSVASRDALAHAAACAHAPSACPECAFLGSPAQLVRPLTAHPHDLTANKFSYGKGFPFVVNRPKEPRQDKYLFVAEEDGGVFLLAVGGQGNLRSFGVVCLRGNADAGPEYRSSIAVICGPCARYEITGAVSSCPAGRGLVCRRRGLG